MDEYTIIGYLVQESFLGYYNFHRDYQKAREEVNEDTLGEYPGLEIIPVYKKDVKPSKSVSKRLNIQKSNPILFVMAKNEKDFEFFKNISKSGIVFDLEDIKDNDYKFIYLDSINSFKGLTADYLVCLDNAEINESYNKDFFVALWPSICYNENIMKYMNDYVLPKFNLN